MPNTAVEREFSVAVGIIEFSGRVLITRRAPSAHLGLSWEFPGGVSEADESLSATLERELREEIGIDVVAADLLLSLTHRYDERQVALSFFRVTCYRGQPYAAENQQLRWVEPAVLKALSFPAANRPIIDLLNTPG